MPKQTPPHQSGTARSSQQNAHEKGQKVANEKTIVRHNVPNIVIHDPDYQRKDNRKMIPASKMDHLRRWQQKATHAKKQFLCVHCLQTPIGRTEDCRMHALCEGCVQPEKSLRADCKFCGIDFMYAKYMEDWFKLSNGLPACIGCIEDKQTYGDPKYCNTCTRRCAFSGSKNCRHCVVLGEKFGEPEVCDGCNNVCAFIDPEVRDELERQGEDKYGGLNLCRVCKRRPELVRKPVIPNGNTIYKAKIKPPKKEKKPARTEEESNARRETQTKEYTNYVEKENALRAMEKQLREAKQTLHRLVQQAGYPYSGTDISTETERKVIEMNKKISQKRVGLDRFKIKQVELEELANTQEKRHVKNFAEASQRHKKEMQKLHQLEKKLICDVDRLQQENHLIEEDLVETGRFPMSGKFPWEEEDEKIKSMQDGTWVEPVRMEDIARDMQESGEHHEMASLFHDVRSKIGGVSEIENRFKSVNVKKATMTKAQEDRLFGDDNLAEKLKAIEEGRQLPEDPQPTQMDSEDEDVFQEMPELLQTQAPVEETQSSPEKERLFKHNPDKFLEALEEEMGEFADEIDLPEEKNLFSDEEETEPRKENNFMKRKLEQTSGGDGQNVKIKLRRQPVHKLGAWVLVLV